MKKENKPDRDQNTSVQDTDPGIIPLAVANEDDQLTLRLVLTAVGIPNFHYPDSNDIYVKPQDLHRATAELAAYHNENHNWPPVQIAYADRKLFRRPPTFFLFSLLALFHAVTGSWDENSRWFTDGVLNNQAVTDNGQWWRLVTALTLHADASHLLGNCIIGGFLVHQLSVTMGYGLSWILLICGGALGNLLNIVFRNSLHQSVGFSTSVFCSIGILCGMQIGKRQGIIKTFLVPIGAGTALLAFLGSSGERTDLGAHFFGLAVGILMGILSNILHLPKRFQSNFSQRLLLVVTACIILSSWFLALYSTHT